MHAHSSRARGGAGFSKPFILYSILGLAAMVVHTPAVSAQPILKAISFEKSSPREERVLFALNGFYPPHAFDLQKPLPRVVCDFPGAHLAPSVSLPPAAEGEFVNAIRVGRHNQPQPRIRVVLDLSPLHDYEIKQVFFEKSNIYAVLVTASQTKSPQPVIESIRFEGESAVKEEVLFFLSGTHSPEVFQLSEGKQRVVCDFTGACLAEAMSETINVGGRFVERIRLGKHGPPEEKIRVVLDLRSGDCAVETAFLKENSVFSVSVRPNTTPPPACRDFLSAAASPPIALGTARAPKRLQSK